MSIYIFDFEQNKLIELSYDEILHGERYDDLKTGINLFATKGEQESQEFLQNNQERIKDLLQDAIMDYENNGHLKKDHIKESITNVMASFNN